MRMSFPRHVALMGPDDLNFSRVGSGRERLGGSTRSMAGLCSECLQHRVPPGVPQKKAELPRKCRAYPNVIPTMTSACEFTGD